MFPQLPEKSMLTGKDFNEILSDAFIGDPLAKKPRTGISPRNFLNPPVDIIHHSSHLIIGSSGPHYSYPG
jgi:hypothetical protein